MFDNPAKPLCWNVHAAKSERILAMAEIASVSEYSDVSVWRTRIDRRNDQKVVLTPLQQCLEIWKIVPRYGNPVKSPKRRVEFRAFNGEDPQIALCGESLLSLSKFS